MPIVIALWPFPPTKKKLSDVVELMIHCTGIFIFLCLGVTYLIALIEAAYGGTEGFDQVYEYINSGQTEPLAEQFDLLSDNFLLLLFATIYGFRLVGKSVGDYTDKFFPDSTGLGNANPMHDRLTQATDFVKQKAMKPIKRVKDIASTQAKRGIAKGTGAIGAKMAQSNNKFVSSMGKSMQARADDFEAKYQDQDKPKQ